jgi:predicted transcriptional regulator
MTYARHKIPPNVRARIANLRRLVAALQTRPMRCDQMAKLLGFTSSGIDRYVSDLRKADVVIESLNTPHASVFHLIDDADRVSEFLSSLNDGMPAKVVARRARSELDIAALNPGRHFHIMEDDSPFHARVTKAIPATWPLLAVFYGMDQENRV